MIAAIVSRLKVQTVALWSNGSSPTANAFAWGSTFLRSRVVSIGIRTNVVDIRSMGHLRPAIVAIVVATACAVFHAAGE